MNSKWICPRCGVSSTTKQNLKNHLRKKKICKPIVADIDRETYISEELYGCKKEINKDVSSFCHHFNKPERHHLSSSVINPSSINKKFINLSSFIKNEEDTKVIQILNVSSVRNHYHPDNLNGDMNKYALAILKNWNKMML